MRDLCGRLHSKTVQSRAERRMGSANCDAIKTRVQLTQDACLSEACGCSAAALEKTARQLYVHGRAGVLRLLPKVMHMDSHQPMWPPLEWPVERARVHVETARCWLCVAQSVCLYVMDSWVAEDIFLFAKQQHYCSTVCIGPYRRRAMAGRMMHA